MKILRCMICEGELRVIGKISDIEKKVRCTCCGFSNDEKTTVVIYKKG